MAFSAVDINKICHIASAFQIQPQPSFSADDNGIGTQVQYKIGDRQRYEYGMTMFSMYVDWYKQEARHKYVNEADTYRDENNELPGQRASFLKCADRYRRAMINEWVFYDADSLYDTSWSRHISGPVEGFNGFDTPRRINLERIREWSEPYDLDVGRQAYSLDYTLQELKEHFSDKVNGSLFFTDLFLLYVMANDEVHGGPNVDIKREMYENPYDDSDDLFAANDDPADAARRRRRRAAVVLRVDWDSKHVCTRFLLLMYMKHTRVADRTWADIYELLYNSSVYTDLTEQNDNNLLLVYKASAASMLGKLLCQQHI